MVGVLGIVQSLVDCFSLFVSSLLQTGCLSVSSIDCSAASLPLQSALDDVEHNELQNSDVEENCNTSTLGVVVKGCGQGGVGEGGNNGE